MTDTARILAFGQGTIDQEDKQDRNSRGHSFLEAIVLIAAHKSKKGYADPRWSADSCQLFGAAIGCVEMIRSSNHMVAAGVLVDPFAPLKYGWRMIP